MCPYICSLLSFQIAEAYLQQQGLKMFCALDRKHDRVWTNNFADQESIDCISSESARFPSFVLKPVGMSISDMEFPSIGIDIISAEEVCFLQGRSVCTGGPGFHKRSRQECSHTPDDQLPQTTGSRLGQHDTQQSEACADDVSPGSIHKESQDTGGTPSISRHRDKRQDWMQYIVAAFDNS